MVPGAVLGACSRLDAKQQNDFYLQGEGAGLKLKEELAKIMKQ